MQPVQDRMRQDRAGCGPKRRFRRLQSQGPVRALVVVLRHELAQDGHEVLLVQNDDMIQTLAPERADYPFRDCVHVRRQLPVVAAIRSDSV